MSELFSESDPLQALAVTVARSRDDAGRLSIPFATRLLDMCLIEIAMAWQGRDNLRRANQSRDPLNIVLETKRRIDTAERKAKQSESIL